VAIGPQTDPATRQFPVEIEVVNPDGRPLKGGMVARVEIVYESFEGIPLVPVDALIEDAEGYTVYTVKDGVARRRRLVPGPRQGSWIGAREGVDVGDSVVVLGQTRLTDGSAVRVEGSR
jgi:membrane fusion protein (multidrug efflux system)